MRGEQTLGEAAMATAEDAREGLSELDQRVQLRRAVVASSVGSIIEAYDFLLYGQVTGLVFGKLYFPASDPLVGTLQAFGIYAVGFASRPIGAAIFGHYGDRIGRKAALIGTLLLTGLATFAVGFVPSYDQIGIWGAVILTMLRFIQGVGVDGEWAGAGSRQRRRRFRRYRPAARLNARMRCKKSCDARALVKLGSLWTLSPPGNQPRPDGFSGSVSVSRI
jgi:hypothetical protein